MKRNKKPNNRKIQIAFLIVLLVPFILFIGMKYFLRDVKSATAPTITSLSSTSGSVLGGGSLTINGTDLANLYQFTSISPGGEHTCAIDADGKVLLNFDTPVLPGKKAKADVAPAEEI